jgi:hypothetical protein
MHQRSTRAALVVLVACGEPHAPPLAHHVGPVEAPVGPAPTVALVDGRLVITGLPAVSVDGTEVVIADEAHEPARGNPALTLVARDRQDRELVHRYVIGFDESEDAALVRTRFADANAWLAAQHRALHLVPLRALAVTALDSDNYHHRADGDGIAVDWQPSTLAISRLGAAPFTHATPSDWLVPDRPMAAGSTELCSNPAFLEAASVDTERMIAVITLAYMGSDTCWEPPAQHHVVHW